MAIRITRYAVCTWGNKNKPDERWYGVRVFVAGKGWMHCCEGANPLLYSTRANASDCIARMKAERTKGGLKRKVAA